MALCKPVSARRSLIDIPSRTVAFEFSPQQREGRSPESLGSFCFASVTRAAFVSLAASAFSVSTVARLAVEEAFYAGSQDFHRSTTSTAYIVELPRSQQASSAFAAARSYFGEQKLTYQALARANLPSQAACLQVPAHTNSRRPFYSYLSKQHLI